MSDEKIHVFRRCPACTEGLLRSGATPDCELCDGTGLVWRDVAQDWERAVEQSIAERIGK